MRATHVDKGREVTKTTPKMLSMMVIGMMSHLQDKEIAAAKARHRQ
jgi:hypothetical protein